MKLSEESIERMRLSILKGYKNGRVTHNKGKTKKDYSPLSIVSSKMMGNKNAPHLFGKSNLMWGKKALKTIASNKRRLGEKRSVECR